jgi:hypothetical protein
VVVDVVGGSVIDTEQGAEELRDTTNKLGLREVG